MNKEEKMKIERIKINNIPSIIWGERSNKVFVHGVNGCQWGRSFLTTLFNFL